MKSIAVMQPYLFPYLGYYQLAHCVDEFVFFDDVNYIKRGFINRNSILRNGAAIRFTLPVVGASQNRLISDHSFIEAGGDVLRIIRESYNAAPFFDNVFPFVAGVIGNADRSVVTIASESIKKVFDYLGIEKAFSFSSDVEKPEEIRGQDKILEICIAKKANIYVNAIGGKHLYDAASFESRGIELKFISMNEVRYRQLSEPFVANLSIIDVLMNCGREEVVNLLESYSLEDGRA